MSQRNCQNVEIWTPNLHNSNQMPQTILYDFMVLLERVQGEKSSTAAYVTADTDVPVTCYQLATKAWLLNVSQKCVWYLLFISGLMCSVQGLQVSYKLPPDLSRSDLGRALLLHLWWQANYYSLVVQTSSMSVSIQNSRPACTKLTAILEWASISRTVQQCNLSKKYDVDWCGSRLIQSHSQHGGLPLFPPALTNTLTFLFGSFLHPLDVLYRL